ncbi:HipA N-terminal domain-containing protein [Dyadobacter sp. Leaf189]|uniref:HipA N-terminal domain-containing protein n=1 Tax=Dyadobacter sp. Leaf189 TaxID=1736295 RepID=UPI0006FDC3B9|nr:HipA N-terminal domain-containing protein [Dyadobacter sp. Leaf189]KQS30741.1 phosphatidylinositol kinase [Dyadobacter sp. Leaf189]
MMRGLVYNNGILAGFLEKDQSGLYTFEYEAGYHSDPGKPAISLTLPKSVRVHQSAELFAFFFGLLSEGVNKDIQCRALRIDENDHFKRLLLTAGDDTIGAITVKPE